MTDWTKYGQTETKEPAPPALRPVDSAPEQTEDDSAPVAQDWTALGTVDSGHAAEVEDYFTAADHDDVEETAPSRGKRKSELRTWIAIVAALLVLLAVAMFVGWSVMRSLAGGDDTQAMETTATSEVAQSEQPTVNEVEPAAATQDRVFGSCEAPGQQVEADQTTSYGAIAAFQKAYYAKDADGVRKVLSKDSPLQKQKWNSVLSQISSNSQFCVTMQPVTSRETEIPATLTVGNKTYEQIVTVVNNGGTWFIKEIKKA